MQSIVNLGFKLINGKILVEDRCRMKGKIYAAKRDAEQ